MPNGERPRGAGTKAGLKKLAQRIRLEIDAGVKQRDVRLKRFDRVKSQYEHEPPQQKKKSFPDASETHVNLMQVKVDALGAHVVNTMTSQEPYCVADAFSGDDVAIFIEDKVQFFMDKGDLKGKLSAISTPIGLFNTGILKTDWKPEGVPGDPTPSIEIKPVEVHNHFAYPATFNDIVDMKSIGDRFYLRKSQIERAQRDGVFIKTDIITSTDPGSDRAEKEPSLSGHIPHDNAGRDENWLVQLWDVTFREPDKDGNDTWWRGTFAYNEQEFLTLDRHEMPRPGYHKFQYKNEYGEYWSKESVGNDLQGAQLDVDDLQRLLIDGLRMNAFGAIFAQSAMMPEQFKNFAPLDIVELQTVGDIVPYNPKADLTFIPPTISAILEYADQIVGISQAGTGGTLDADTATEATIINAGQQSGIDDKLGSTNRGLVSAYDYVHGLIAIHMREWLPWFSEVMGIEEGDEQMLLLPTLWQPHTKSVGATPGNQLQLAQMALEQANVPGSSINRYQLDTKLLQNIERLGFSNARGLQLPQDINGVIQTVAQQSGIDPQLLADCMEQAQQLQTLAEEGESNERKEEIIKTARVGLGLPEEKPCLEGDSAKPARSPRPAKKRA